MALALPQGSFGAAFGSVISGVVCDFLPGNGVLIFTVTHAAYSHRPPPLSHERGHLSGAPGGSREGQVSAQGSRAHSRGLTCAGHVRAPGRVTCAGHVRGSRAR
eukprot:7311799-Prymnesium_polylepis.2